MKQFIVPVDFSDTSKNAARFAAHLTAHVSDSELILFNIYDRMEGGSDGTPLEPDEQAHKQLMELALHSVQNELSAITPAKIIVVAEEGKDFVDSMESYVHRKGIDMIIMGITGTHRLGQIFMGSHTLDVVKR